MPTPRENPTTSVSVTKSASGTSRGAPNTYVAIAEPSRWLHIGEIVELDITDGFRYRTWEVRITRIRVIERLMVELVTRLHGPDDGALPIISFLQCRRDWVNLGPMPCLQILLSGSDGNDHSIPVYPPPPRPSVNSAELWRTHLRRESRDSVAARQSQELVGRISYTIETTTTASTDSSDGNTTASAARHAMFSEGGIQVESGRAARSAPASF
ncbi:hypothetical protein C2E23DRAFT_886946 [Lenzites betulinus]|nr:hypothetical protein C2E23DRAFT_886946 [Lenzites betulinus]